jgi:serine/threonine-protein kinase
LLADGQLLSHYRVLHRLGAGGMGEVFLAEDGRLGRKVALKILRPGVAGDRQGLDRFAQEARAASALNHPNILTIYDVGEWDGVPFIATEFIDGETLRARLGRGRIDPARAVDIGTQIARALAAAHEAGIVHRDIKPENVMLRRDGYVKVLDFGLAKLTGPHALGLDVDGVTRAAVDTKPGLVLGTFHHMSPEQARGQAVDARSDLFSAGVVLYEMIAGRLPFTGSSAADVIGAILHVEPAPLASLAAVPEALSDLVDRAVRKRPEDRFQAAREMRDQLEAIARGMSQAGISGLASAAASSSLQPAASDARSQAGSRLTPAAGGLDTPAPKRRRAKRTIDSLAVLPLDNGTRDAEAEYLSDGITEAIINNLSQLPKLRVMARSTVFRFKGRPVDPIDAGRELAVRAVLTGRLLQRGDTLVVGAELVDVEDGSQLWGGQFTRRLSGIFQLQEEISNEITDGLRLRLSGDEKKRLARPQTTEGDAYHEYLKGRYLLNKRTAGALSRAVAHFEAAIAKDPRYAAAHAGLGDAYALSAAVGLNIVPPREAIARANAAAARALDLDETLGEAHALAGFLKFRFDWDWRGAELEYRRALELHPGSASAHHGYGMYLAAMARFDEAFRETARAQELDPLSMVVACGAGRILHFAGRYDEAIARFRQVIEMDPAFARVRFDLGLALLMKGDYEQAMSELETAGEMLGSPAFALHLRAVGSGVMGRHDVTRAALGQLERYRSEGQLGADDLAMVYGAMGQLGRAAELLEEACRQRAASLAYIGVEPVLAYLRDDPGCRAILERAGLLR